jgi:hypothetical protein
VAILSRCKCGKKASWRFPALLFIMKTLFWRANTVITHDEGGAVVSMLDEFMPSFLRNGNEVQIAMCL